MKLALTVVWVLVFVLSTTGSSAETLTVSQAAKYAGVDQSTIRRWTDSGQLECQRTGPGGHRRIPKSAIDLMKRPHEVDIDRAAPPERTLARWEQVTAGWGGWRPGERMSEDTLAALRQSARHLVSDLETVISTITAELGRRDG